jgi:hypothetical protein
VSDWTIERIQRNNDIFKQANEGIREAADEHEHGLNLIPFICECPVEDCVEILRLSREDYEEIRSNPDLYVTAVGHETAEAPIGTVVARHDRYIVVEK